MIKKILNKLKIRKEMRNQFESIWLRKYFYSEFGIVVGMYSYGCFDSRRVPRGTVVGRYCSFSSSCRFLNGNHGLSFLSLHPYLYNKSLGLVSKETIVRTNFIVEDDVWIGEGAIILPSVEKIGRGAVVAAGAVVAKSVEPYEIVGGVPAKTIRYRFDKSIISSIEETKWWLWSKDELENNIINRPDLVYMPSMYFQGFGSHEAR